MNPFCGFQHCNNDVQVPTVILRSIPRANEKIKLEMQRFDDVTILPKTLDLVYEKKEKRIQFHEH